ncbi:MAG: nucleotidyltransferase domain-containing protein [Sedimentisphaerales bacterium]|nr:nucleotidyltransferase domain-containing protein [Sedimentisphaerales bacterium]
MVTISDELIDRMAQRIVREVDPEKIVLFGSWARGEASEQSDVDLLVVEREPFGPNRSRRQEAVRIWQCLYEFRVPKDILVYSIDELDRWKGSSYHVVGRALKEGKVLYESDRRAP